MLLLGKNIIIDKINNNNKLENEYSWIKCNIPSPRTFEKINSPVIR